MKHIRNLWNLLKQEISLWKYEKQELVKGTVSYTHLTLPTT